MISEQFTDLQENTEALPAENVTFSAELPEASLEATWLKDNVPLSMADGKCQTINQDSTNQLVIPNVATEDTGEYKVQGDEYESTVPLTVKGG